VFDNLSTSEKSSLIVDFALEIAGSFRFFLDYFRGRPEAHGHGHLQRENLVSKFLIRRRFYLTTTQRTDEAGRPKPTFGQAFNVTPKKYVQVGFFFHLVLSNDNLH
jgi:hypothetical protein